MGEGRAAGTLGSVGVLVLHGFTGAPTSVEPIARALRAEGFDVEAPLLPGHGTSTDDLARSTFAEWIDAVEVSFAALSKRCSSVGVVGLSMGGALACHLAETHLEIAGVVLINPFVEPPAPEFLVLLTEALESGSTTIPSIGSDIADPGHPDTGGNVETPVAPLISLCRGVERIAADLDKIAAPVLLLSSRIDHVVPPSNGDFLERSLRCPVERVMLEESYHVATLDYDGPAIVRRCVEFMERVAS